MKKAPLSVRPPSPARRRFLKAALLLGLAGWGGRPEFARASERLAEILARENIADLRQYLVSEKLDGVRARWDGEKLLSRKGNPFAAPQWFTANFPAQPLDGELWMGRGQFERVSGAVRRKADPDAWRNVRYFVFDLPSSPAPFAVRAAQIPNAVGGMSEFLQFIPHFPADSEDELSARFAEVVQNGGEGLMLRKKDSTGARKSDFAKLKPRDDADATVIARNPGKGRHAGRMGSLTVEDENGRRFRVGSGFTDAQRENPPPTGAVITYRHSGFTNTGLPRFPVFLRARDDEPQND